MREPREGSPQDVYRCEQPLRRAISFTRDPTTAQDAVDDDHASASQDENRSEARANVRGAIEP